MDNQRLRNLTTGRLHTSMDHIYEDIEFITGEKGMMTHHIGMANTALKPYLQANVSDERFWNGEYDTEHAGDTDIKPMTDLQRAEFFALFNKQPNPLLDRLAK